MFEHTNSQDDRIGQASDTSQWRDGKAERLKQVGYSGRNCNECRSNNIVKPTFFVVGQSPAQRDEKQDDTRNQKWSKQDNIGDVSVVAVHEGPNPWVNEGGRSRRCHNTK